MQTRMMKIIMVLVLIIIASYSIIHHLSNEFWNDEIYTLIHFVLVPFKATLFDYHVPNNHILFSLLARSYLGFIGYGDLPIILENPVIARLPLVIIATAIVCYYWKITAFFFTDNRWRFISVLLLISNAVFGNFVFQYRGYGLSTLFLTVIFYCLLKIIYTDQKNTRSYMLLLLASFGAFYTVPVNLYFVVALGMFPVALQFFKWNTYRSFFASNAFKAGVFLVVGLLLGLLAYSAIFQEVFNNNVVKSSQPFVFTNFERMIKALLALSSFYLILFAFGIYYLVSKALKKDLQAGSRLWFPLVVCCLPFVFSFLHGDIPSYRVYSVLVPFVSLLLTQSLVLISQRLRYLNTDKAFIILPVYILCHFALGELYISERLAYDNSTGQRNQSLLFQYYNYHFNAMDMLNTIQEDAYKDIPIYVQEHFDGTDLLTEAYGIKISQVKPDTLSVNKGILITNKPHIVDGMDGRFPYILTNINSERNYFKLYLLAEPD